MLRSWRRRIPAREARTHRLPRTTRIAPLLALWLATALALGLAGCSRLGAPGTQAGDGARAAASASSGSRAAAADVGATPPPTAPAPAGATFDDEFAGPLDAGSWQVLTPWRTTYPAGDLGYYDPANVSVSHGALHVQTTQTPGDHYYASGVVTSLPHAPFSYGYFEVRALMPRGKGVWPAIWLTDDSGLEIDISEVLGGEPSKTYMTLHEHGNVVYQQVYDGPDFSAGWHTFGADWQRDHVIWYVDGVERARYEGAIPPDPQWICLDTAIGGAWPGYPDASTRFPQSFDIDYVRVYPTRPSAP